jgi:hypothetical protein
MTFGLHIAEGYNSGQSMLYIMNWWISTQTRITQVLIIKPILPTAQIKKKL